MSLGIDTIIPQQDGRNMSPKSCREWWRKKVAEGYFKGYTWELSAPDLYKRAGLGETTRVLELGCGYGRQVSQFLKMTPYVWALDVSEAAVEICRAHCPEVDAKTYDGRKIFFEDNSFDLVTSVFVMQHVSKETARRLAEESARVLAVSGRMLHEFLGGHGVAGEGNEHYSRGPDGGIYNNGYSLQEARELCAVPGTVEVFAEERNITDDGVTNVWICRERIAQ